MAQQQGVIGITTDTLGGTGNVIKTLIEVAGIHVRASSFGIVYSGADLFVGPLDLYVAYTNAASVATTTTFLRILECLGINGAFVPRPRLHSIELGFTLSSGVGVADGSFTLCVNGAVVVTASSIITNPSWTTTPFSIWPLGYMGSAYVLYGTATPYPGYGQVYPVPGESVGPNYTTSPPSTPITNPVPSNGANVVWSETFDGLTLTEIAAFWTLPISVDFNLQNGYAYTIGGLFSHTGITPPSTLPPTGTEFCECVPPPGTTTPPPGGPPVIPVNPPPIETEIGEQFSCLGGGLVPIQPDLVYAEQWWGMG